MRVARFTAEFVLLRARSREQGESVFDAAHRRAVPGDAVLRQSAHGGAPGACRVFSESQANSTTDADDGAGRVVSRPKNDNSGTRAQSVSVLAAGADHRSSQSGVVQRHYVLAAATRVSVSGGRDGLVQPARARLAVVEYAGCGV